MVELLLMDDTITENSALKYVFLERAANIWLQGSVSPTLATPSQLHTVFRLIKAEYDERLGANPANNDVIMQQSRIDEEEVKGEDSKGELILKKMSSDMQSVPYSRVTALVKGVELL